MLCHAVLTKPRFNDSCSVGKDGKGDVHAIGYDPERVVLLGKVSEPFQEDEGEASIAHEKIIKTYM